MHHRVDTIGPSTNPHQPLLDRQRPTTTNNCWTDRVRLPNHPHRQPLLRDDYLSASVAMEGHCRVRRRCQLLATTVALYGRNATAVALHRMCHRLCHACRAHGATTVALGCVYRSSQRTFSPRFLQRSLNFSGERQPGLTVKTHNG